MGRVVHHKGNLFDVPRNSQPVLVHAVNTMGMWGAGIALDFKERFPVSYRSYEHACHFNAPENLLGSYGTHVEDSAVVCWLFVAIHPGKQKPVYDVVRYTEAAIKKLCADVAHTFPRAPTASTFHSPRINSGLFGVPWQLTEDAIERAIRKSLFDWNVWTL